MFDIEKTHFSFFDLFAYFIPGAITLLLIRAFDVIWDVSYEGVSDWCYLIGIRSIELHTWMDAIGFFLLAYLVGHVVSFLSTITVEAYSHWRYKYPSDFLMLRSRLNESTLDISAADDYLPKGWLTKFLQGIIIVFILPVSVLELILGECLKCKYYYLKPLDRVYTDVIDDRIMKLMEKLAVGDHLLDDLDKDDITIEADCHRIAYHYELEKLAIHEKKLDGYIALYDFHRAITLILVCMFWTYLLFLVHNGFHSASSIAVLVILFVLPYLFFIIFMKFYRRHTLETFMCLITDEDLCEKSVNNPKE